MSIKIMNAVWSSQLPTSISKNKRSTVKIVLLKLADNSNDNGKCWPSMARIAHETELSERSVIRAIDDLKEANLIQVHTYRKNGVKHNTYYLNTPLIDSMYCGYQNNQECENDNPFTNPSDNLSIPSDTLSGKDASLSLKPPITINESSKKNTDISLVPKENGYFIDSLDKKEFKHCHEVMDYLKRFHDGFVYTGSLSMQEWIDCEDAMNSVDNFDHIEYPWWWLKTRSKSFKKTPSLPNMLCYFDKRGTDFETFYNSTFMQERD